MNVQYGQYLSGQSGSCLRRGAPSVRKYFSPKRAAPTVERLWNPSETPQGSVSQDSWPSTQSKERTTRNARANDGSGPLLHGKALVFTAQNRQRALTTPCDVGEVKVVRGRRRLSPLAWEAAPSLLLGHLFYTNGRLWEARSRLLLGSQGEERETSDLDSRY